MIKKVPPGAGPVFAQPPSSPIQVIVTGPMDIKSTDPKVKIVKKG